MQKELFDDFSEEKELLSMIPLVKEEIINNRLNLETLKRCGKFFIHGTEGPKAVYTEKLARALCSKKKFLAYYDSCSDAIKKILLDFAFKPFMLKATVLKAAGKDYNAYYRLYDSHTYEDLPLSFVVHYDWYSTLEVPPAIKKCLKSHLAEFHYKKKELSASEFENASGYFSEKNGLEFYLNSVQIVQFLNDSGFFQKEPGSNILKGTLTKLNNIAIFTPFAKEKDLPPAPKEDANDWEEFSSYSKKERERILDARLILPIALLSLAVNKINLGYKNKNHLMELIAQPQKMIKEVFESFCSAGDCRFDEKFLYPHLTVHQGYFHEVSEAYRAKMFNNFITVIKSNPPTNPVDFEQYLEKISERGLPHFFNIDKNDNYFRMATNYDYSYSDKFEMSRDRVDVNTSSTYTEYVEKPGYNNLFLALAAMGFFEITWNISTTQPQNKIETVQWRNDLDMYPYGKIGYIKLTQLGSYAFGLLSKIEIKGVKSYAPPQLDTNSLLVHIEKGDKTMQLFLKPFCTAISQTLYKVDEERLKKYCKTKEDVNSIFSTLSARAESSLPPAWKKLKQSILSSFVTLKHELDWAVINLDGQSPEFVHCIERLSRAGFCSKMEGKRVAVKQSELGTLLKKIELEGFKV